MEIEKIIDLVRKDYKIFTASESKKIIEKYCYALDIDNGQKEIYIFIGPSGSGKSTFISNLYASNILNLPYINRFVFNEQYNANTTLDEEIFTKLNLAKYGRSFVLETASTDNSNIRFYKKLKKLGYSLNIFIMTAKDIEINLSNIQKRSKEGGHTTDAVRVQEDTKRIHKYFSKICGIGTNVVYVKNMTSNSNARMIIPIKLDGKEHKLNPYNLQSFLNTPNLKFDMHMHTTYSDGVFTLKEMLAKIKDSGLDFVAITDHNSVRAHEELEKLKIDKSQYTIFTGTEINALFGDYRVEVLAYGYDLDKFKHFKHLNPKFRLGYYEKQLQELLSIADKLNLKYTKGLKAIPNQTPAGLLYTDLVKYKENEKFFKDHGIIHKNQFCRAFCYNKATELYVKDYGTPTVEEVCDYIHKCGGVAVLAHIYNYGLTDPNSVLKGLIELDCLDGIEVLYPNFTMAQIDYLKKLCHKHKLMMTGGSDYHTTRRIYNNKEYKVSLGHLPISDLDVTTTHIL